MKKFLIILLGFLIPLFCFAEADYVYHEATTNTIGLTSLQFRDIMTPNRTQSVKIGFKIEFQFYWNQARIYYTTDGSNPSGAFGVGNGTTQVVNVTFDHNFGSPVVDAVFGVIPAQPAGTVVKYIVSAWFAGGGDEIFGNGCGNAPRTFCASDNKLSSQATVFQYTVLRTPQRIFTLDPNPNVNIDGSFGSCAAPGSSQPNVFNVSVSGVGTMSAVNQLTLASICLNDCGTGIKNFNAVQIRVMAPNGQCFGVYSGGLTTNGSGTHCLNLVSNNPCLNNPNTSNEPNTGSPLTVTGNNGYYNAQFNGTPTIYSNFTGSADGTWKIIFSESTVNPPCVDVIRLFFGDPNYTDQSVNGDNCSNPIVWDGTSQICGNTLSKSGSTQMPGSIGGPNTNTFGTIGGQTCGWNFANNNDVWIKYVAKKTTTCLSISGISGTSVSLQSMVVTDANTNDSDPCTQIARTPTNDPNWQVVSCPRPSIYGTTAGTQFNQQHCFTSEPGKTYYLVVDGDGGASSKFFIWGFDFDGVLNLQETRTIYPIPTIKDGLNVSLYGSNLVSDFGRKKLNQEVFIYDGSGKLVVRQKNFVSGQHTVNINNLVSPGIFFIKVLVYNDLMTNFTFKLIKK
jgi:hypothetical protein